MKICRCRCARACCESVGTKGIPKEVKPSEIFELTKNLDGKSYYTFKSFAYIGFDDEETLQSLVINVTKNNLEVEDDEILEKCKECLIAIASSDGIVRAERSSLERDEIGRWKDVYFHQQNHDSLCSYFSALFNQEKSLANPIRLQR